MNNLKPIIFLFPVIALILIAILYITLQKKVTNKSAFNSLILIITVFAFFLNLLWELLQMPLYDRASFTINHTTFCALGAVADAIMVLLLYLGCALIFKTPFWIHQLKWQRIVILVITGGIGAALSEMRHLSLGNWAYSDVMPLIPIINVGILPVLQFMILPVFTYILSFYGLKIINSKNLNLE